MNCTSLFYDLNASLKLSESYSPPPSNRILLNTVNLQPVETKPKLYNVLHALPHLLRHSRHVAKHEQQC
eukprot:g2811.t1